MKRFLLFLSMAAIITFTVSCSDSKNTDKGDGTGKEGNIIVASQRPYLDPAASIAANCIPSYIIKYSETGEWTTLNSAIKDFEYKEGYEYVLEVSEIKDETLCQKFHFELIEVISSVKKDSKGIPSEYLPPAK